LVNRLTWLPKCLLVGPVVLPAYFLGDGNKFDKSVSHIIMPFQMALADTESTLETRHSEIADGEDSDDEWVQDVPKTTSTGKGLRHPFTVGATIKDQDIPKS
jgi:hypothetical protein